MNSFFNNFFWFVEGIFVCLIFIGFKRWMKNRGVRMTIWKWILFAAWLFLSGFTIAFITTSIGEGEDRAALMGGIIFGIITIVSGVGIWRALNIKGKVSNER